MKVHNTPFSKALNRLKRRSLLRLFDLPKEMQRGLWKSNFAPENPNLYRGWFPLESGATRCRWTGADAAEKGGPIEKRPACD